MTTLITGAGFVGSVVAAQLVARGDDTPVLLDIAFSVENLRDKLDLDSVKLVKADVTDLGAVRNAIEQHGVSRIIHTAALLHRGVGAQPFRGVEVNVMGAMAVLEAARLTNVTRVVNVSAGSVVLGKAFTAQDVVSEHVALDCVDERPPNLYSTAKLATEWLFSNYRETYGLSTATIRAAGTFGPWIGPQRGHPAGLMRAIVEGGVRHGRVCLPDADIQQSIDFVYSADVAQGLIRAADRPEAPSHVYNVSMGRSQRVVDIIAMLSDVLGREVVAESSSEPSTGMFQAPAPGFDISRAMRELDYMPAFPMRRALEDFAAWIERQPAQD
jgi:UDP-glucose 4-epimerase